MAVGRQLLLDELGQAMQAYQRSVQAFDDAVARRLGLNGADLRCLDWLADGPKTAGQLSKGTGLRPAATTALVDRLVRKGYVRRVPSEEDRRLVLVEMTEQGMERTWECYGPMVQEGQALMAHLGTDELVAMRDLLREIQALTDRHRESLQTDPED